MVRVHNSIVNDLGGSGGWVKIESLENRKYVYGVIRGHGKDDSVSKNAIELDCQTSKNHLGIATQKAISEVIQKNSLAVN